jgi:hypothetical protein
MVLVIDLSQLARMMQAELYNAMLPYIVSRCLSTQCCGIIHRTTCIKLHPNTKPLQLTQVSFIFSVQCCGLGASETATDGTASAAGDDEVLGSFVRRLNDMVIAAPVKLSEIQATLQVSLLQLCYENTLQ